MLPPKLTLSERAKANMPLFGHVARSVPVVPPLPICSVPPLIVVVTDGSSVLLPERINFAVPFFVKLIGPLSCPAYVVSAVGAQGQRAGSRAGHQIGGRSQAGDAGDRLRIAVQVQRAGVERDGGRTGQVVGLGRLQGAVADRGAARPGIAGAAQNRRAVGERHARIVGDVEIARQGDGVAADAVERQAAAGHVSADPGRKASSTPPELRISAEPGASDGAGKGAGSRHLIQDAAAVDRKRLADRVRAADVGIDLAAADRRAGGGGAQCRALLSVNCP